jgi:carboxymethylenebutenolidase
MGEHVDIAAADGSGTFRAYVARPGGGSEGTGGSGAPRVGIVVAQEIFGVNEYVRRTADRFAEAGYVVYAPDLFWRIEPGIDLGYSPDDWQRAFSLFGAFDVDRGIDDIRATVAALRNDLAGGGGDGGVGCVGYCLGGKLAMLTAARTDVDCAVSYYGVGLETHLDEVAAITCPILFHFAERDSFAPQEARDTVQAAFAAKANATFHTYPGCEHAFSREEGEHYDPTAATLAAERTMALFASVLGPGSR